MRTDISITFCDRCNSLKTHTRGQRGYFVSDAEIHEETLRLAGWRKADKRVSKSNTILNGLDICPDCLKEGKAP